MSNEPKSIAQKTKKSETGRISRAAGKLFENFVRKDLEDSGWIVVKWSNQVDLENNKLVRAKSKFNPFLGRVMSEGSGLPDWLIFRRISGEKEAFDVVGVESKMGKYLDAVEKKKCQWLIDNRIFNYILIASKDKVKRGKIIYEKFA